MKKDAITFETICSRLERAIHADVGMTGLDILIYGWIAKHGRCSNQQLRQRKKADGVRWLSLSEARSFSRYAGYDLTKD